MLFLSNGDIVKSNQTFLRNRRHKFVIYIYIYIYLSNKILKII